MNPLLDQGEPQLFVFRSGNMGLEEAEAAGSRKQEAGINSKHNQLDAQLVLNIFKLALLGPERGEGWFQKFLLLLGFETFHRVSLPLIKVCCSVAKSCLTL